MTDALRDRADLPLRRRTIRYALVEVVLVVGVLGAYVAYVAPTLGRPLLEKHAFRQTQTAFTARVYHEEGIDLLHPQLPVLGEPFEVPFEFPLFQAAAAAVMDAGVAEDRAMRTTGLACFLLTALLLFGLVRYVAGPVSAAAALIAFVMTPFAIVWGRASMMEYLATAGAVGFAWSTIVWRERGRPLAGALALIAGLVGMLVKPTTAIFWIVPALAYRLEREPEGATPRVTVRLWTAVLVLVPIVAALLWTRHADAVKAASATTAWLTSGELREWNFGTIGQRFELETWKIILKRLGPNVLGVAGILLLPSAIATFKSEQRRFWVGVWIAAIGPLLVFTSLYRAHDYYLAAVAPTFAALVGLGAGYVWARLPRHPAAYGAAVAAGLLLVYAGLESGRGYWLRIHGADDDAQVAPLAAQIASHTNEDDLVAIVWPDWSPAVLYYARRWGLMVTGPTRDVAYGLLHEDGYRYLLATELGSSDVVELGRWRYVGVLDRDLYALADDTRGLGDAAFVTTDEPPASRLREQMTPLSCGQPFTVQSHPEGTWLRFSAASPGRLLQLSDELAPLPIRRYVWIGPRLARAGKVVLSCMGAPELTLEAIGAGGRSPA